LAPVAIVTRDLMVRTKRGHAFTGPPISAPGQLTTPVERISQQIIRTDVGQDANGLDDLRSGVGAMLTAAASRQAQLGMHTTLPMYDEEDFTGLRVDVYDHLPDQGADDPLLQTRVRVRAVPHHLQVRRQMFKVLPRGCCTLRLSLTVFG